MLSYALAIVVAFSSLVLFSTAFFMSDIHRRDDFLWSGVGLFYALVLWFCARNITGAVLLGQAAVTGLLVSYSWQTLKLRKAIANPASAAEISNFSVLQSINSLLKRDRSQTQPAVTPTESPTIPKVTEQEIAIPEATKSESESSAVKDSQSDTAAEVETTPKVDANIPTDVKPVEEQTTVEVVNADSQPTATDEVSQAEENKTSLTESQKLDSLPKPEPENRVVPSNTSSENAETASIASPIESETKSETKAESSAISQPEEINMPKVDVEPESESVSTQEENLPDVNMPQVDVEPESESVSNQSQPTQTVKPKKASLFDSLETVEVTEVLEAIPEDVSRDPEADDLNIIEVTTTEIDITTEVKVEPDRHDKPDSEKQ